MVGHDGARLTKQPRCVDSGRNVVRDLGQREGRIRAKHPRRVGGEGYASDVEAFQEIAARSVVVEERNPTPGADKVLDLDHVEARLGMDDEERVRGAQLFEVEPARSGDS